MATNTVKAFFEKVERDKALQAKMKALGKKQNDTLEAAMADLIELAKAEGFEFTAQDFIKVREESVAVSVEGENAATKARITCGASVAWRDNPPPEGCLVLEGCGYQHPNWQYPSCSIHQQW